jgi:hypothetical protein
VKALMQYFEDQRTGKGLTALLLRYDLQDIIAQLVIHLGFAG